MKIAYSAYDRSGRSVNAVLEAPGVAEATEQLRREGLFVTEATEATDGLTPRGASRIGGQGARLKEMAAFVRQLSVLVSTGTPMVEAITSLERQTPAGRFRDALQDIRERVEQGASFSSALEHHPRYFDAVARSLIAAGESGGRLDDMLKRLAALTRQQIKIRASISGAMVYPCLLVCVCISVLTTMLFFVLPRFEGLFESLGAPLPPTTRMLMDFSAFLRGYWWAVLACAVPAAIGARAWASSASGRMMIHRFAVSAPQLGNLMRAFATARIARVLGVLLEGRVPMLDALRLTRESSGNLCYESVISDAEDAVIRGENISSVFASTPLISRSVTEAVRSAERTGQMAPVLLTIADFLDEDNEVVLRSLSSIVEPLILIVLGVLVGFVAISMFLPLFDLATAAQTGGGA